MIICGENFDLNPTTFEYMVARELKVEQQIQQIFLYGKSGSLTTNWRSPYELIKIIKPSIILLQLGSNDLARGVKFEHVENSLLQIAQELTQKLSCVVGILSTVPRLGGLSFPMTFFF